VRVTPPNVTRTVHPDGSIELAWDPVSGATGYVLSELRETPAAWCPYCHTLTRRNEWFHDEVHHRCRCGWFNITRS
jgi:hypothetical protein